jgi:hypothetical protein
VTDPRSAPAPGDSSGSSPGSEDVVAHIESAGHDVAGVSDGPLSEAMVRLDALHRELQGALADLDQA